MVHIEGREQLDARHPQGRAFLVIEVRGHHDRPFQPLGAVIGEHGHRVAAGDDGLQIERRGVGRFQPEQEPGERGGGAQGFAMRLISRRQAQERIEVALPLGGGDGIRPPSRHDLPQPGLIDHAARHFERALRQRFVSECPQAADDRVRGAPLPRRFAVRQPLEPLRQPSLRRRPIGEGHHLGDGQRVARIVHAAQAGARQGHLGHLAQSVERHLHRHAAAAQSAGDGLHVVVGARQHRNVAEAQGAWCVRVGIDDVRGARHQLRHALRERLGGIVLAAPGETPMRHRRVRQTFVALRRQHHIRAFDAVLGEGRGEHLVDVVRERRAGAPVSTQAGARRAAGREATERIEHQLLIAAAELVDRLLHVADEDGLAGKAGQFDEEGELHGIGVLELIDQEQFQLGAEALRHAAVIQRVEQERFHVAEVDDAGFPLERLKAAAGPRRDAEHALDGGAQVLVQVGIRRIGEAGVSHGRRQRLAGFGRLAARQADPC